MLAYQVCRAQTEGRMVVAQRNQVFVILEHLWVALQVLPVQMIDAVGRFK